MVELGPEISALEEEVAAEGGSTEVAPGQLRLFTLDQGMPTLLKLSMTFAAVGIVALGVAMVEWLANLAQRATSWIPFFGKTIDAGIQKGVQFLSSRIGLQYNGIDSEIGTSLHQLATELRLLGADMIGAGFGMFKLAQYVAALSRKPNLAPIVHNTQKTVTVLRPQVKTVTRKVVKIQQVIRAPLPAWVPRRIGTLETQVKRQQAEIVALQAKIQHQQSPATLAQAAPIVALGLAGLGLNAARCEGPRTFDKALCEAGPQGLGRLLNLLGLGLGFIGLVELAKLEQDVVHDVANAVHDYWRV